MTDASKPIGCPHDADRIENDEVVADEHERICLRQVAPIGDYRERVKQAVQAMIIHESGLIVCPDCGFGWDLVEVITAIANGENLDALFQKWREHPSNTGREKS